MRIGIDARELCGHPTGVGRYLSGLLSAWRADDRAAGHQFVLYAPTQPAITPDAARFGLQIVAGSGGTWWEQCQLPAAAARDRLDVFFAPAYSTALVHRMPTVVAIHDLSFLAHPEWFTTREGARRRWLVRQSAARARAIITISEFSKREILDRLHVPEDRVHVIPPGVSLSERVAARRPSGADVTRPRVLYVGSIFNRRHVPDLIRAFAPIARAHPSALLDIVGDNRSSPHQDLERLIAEESLKDQVRWRTYVADEELADLYASTRAFAFLSEYEGLGLTPLEALAASVPAVLLDTPVARESCGDAAIYVGAGDVASTTRALNDLLFDDRRRATLVSKAPAAVSKYDWPRAARETLALLEQSGSVGTGH